MRRAEPGLASTNGRGGTSSNDEDPNGTLQSLRGRLEAREQEILRLKSVMKEFRQGGIENTELSRVKQHAISLEKQLRASEEARQSLLQTLSTLQDISEHSHTHPITNEIAEPDWRETSRAQPGENLERQRQEIVANYESQLHHHRQQIVNLEERMRIEAERAEHTDQTLKTKIQELTDLRQELRAKADEESRLRDEVKQLRDAVQRIPELESELLRLRHELEIPRTPSMLQFRSLELKIETLTQKHVLREAELKDLLAKASESNRLEKLSWERFHQNAIALKNAEIRRFKLQLEEILDELELLRGSG
ncbi:hypothetical protein PINS_up003765 [Pythium insidiosum]|nr:hypothetical protein PINS_up003765 [Pythium insidiosum]